MRIALRNKATKVGDFLTSQLKAAASWKATPTGRALQGVFANVGFSNLTDVRNLMAVTEGEWKVGAEQVEHALTQVAVPAALAAIVGTSVPLVKQLAQAYFAAGLQLARMLNESTAIVMPWTKYRREADEDLTNLVLNDYGGGVDRTQLFRPPWSNPSTPWRFGVGGSKKDPFGFVWAPLEGKDDLIPWSKSGDIGALPGTQRMFGPVQVTRPRPPADPRLNRVIRRPQGFTPREATLPWPPTVTNNGDFYPSATNAAAVLWNMAEKAGYPDMYTIRAEELIEAWGHAFEALEQSFADLWNNPLRLMQDIYAKTISEARMSLGAAMEPWIAVRLRDDPRGWLLGSPFKVPHGFALITPNVYKGLPPGDPAGRTTSLWIEEDLPRRVGALTWPYGSFPKQHACSKRRACDADLAAVVDAERVVSSAKWKTATGPAPDGYRKVPWPPPEADAAEFASPFDALIHPTLNRLRLQQERSLQTTLVCAYVRHQKVGPLEAYGAFRGADGSPAAKLAKLCEDMRARLLTHPLRFRVALADVQDIDPAFADQLRASGVTGGPLDFGKSLGLAAAAQLVESAEPPPAGEPPQGGVPFRGELVKAARGGSGKLAAAAAALLGAVVLTRS
ncbi:hypothetical protein OV203_44910 [Nannocystis sp. ILAH1]|uniref:hypothetical protein n=1 Tax=Nannocystis sp. ILAH1 TaxID=2996789 RepID=UPI00226FBDD3|nr:hypothetical protein [Nannocystis sp. ILAH1]MCY0994350.1 hypothetical protein [Nannocystis sp. ILAH1]